ncbi:TPA: glucosyltransferase domain-containing protein [Escherichia coli]
MIRPDKRYLFYIFAVCIAYSLPVILYGRYYIDDLSRSISGGSDWANGGRPLTDFIIETLMFKLPVIDISPIPQVLGISLISITIYFLSRKTFPENKFIGAICFIPLMTSPFFLENISYKFDSLTMAIAIISSCLCGMTMNSGWRSTIAASFLCVLIILNTYQAALNSFIIFTLLYFFLLFKDKKYASAISYSACSFIGMLSGYYVYSRFIAPNYVKGEYTIVHSQLINITEKDAFGEVLRNIHNFTAIINEQSPKIISIFFCALFIISLTYCIYLSTRRFVRGDILNNVCCVIVVIIPFLILLCIPGAMIFLKYPVFAPRVMLGLSAAYCVLMAIACDLRKQNKMIAYAALIPMLLMFQISFSFANAQRAQNVYEIGVMSSIKSVMTSIGYSNIKTISISGEISRSPVTSAISNKYKIINKLVPLTLRDGWVWGISQLRHNNIYKDVKNSSGIKFCDWSTRFSAPDFDGYYNNGVFVIDFARKCSK